MPRNSRLPALALCLLAGACGGSASAPTQYPSVTGNWSGTLTVRVGVVGNADQPLPGVPSVITCAHAWRVASQNDGSFSGSFETSGSDSACAQAGTVSGTMTTSGSLIMLTFDPTLGQPAGCAHTGLLGFNATVTGGTTLSAQITESVTCTANGSAYIGQRAVSLSLNRATP